jgi:hypothetical protein
VNSGRTFASAIKAIAVEESFQLLLNRVVGWIDADSLNTALELSA